MDVVVAWASLMIGGAVAFVLYSTSRFVEDVGTGFVAGRSIYYVAIIMLSLAALGFVEAGLFRFLREVEIPGARIAGFFLGPVFLYSVYLLGWHAGRHEPQRPDNLVNDDN